MRSHQYQSRFVQIPRLQVSFDYLAMNQLDKVFDTLKYADCHVIMEKTWIIGLVSCFLS